MFIFAFDKLVYTWGHGEALCHTTSLILMSILWVGVSQVLQVRQPCSSVETVPWIRSRSVYLYIAERGTDFGKMPIKPRGV